MNRNNILLNSIVNKKIPNENLDSLDDWQALITRDKHLLTVLHINICSLGKHWDWLNIKLSKITHELDVLVLTEINVKSEEAECYQLKNFKQISTCRVGRGGGIMIFIRDTYIPETLPYNFDEAENIILLLKHQTNKSQFKLVTIYRSPKQKQQAFIEDLTWWRKITPVEYNLRHKQKFEKHLPKNKFGERLLSYKIPDLLDKFCSDFLEERNMNIIKKKLKLKLLQN